MKKSRLQLAILSTIGATALGGFASQAAATAITADLTSTINNPTGYTTASNVPAYVWDGGNIGYGAGGGKGDCVTNDCANLPVHTGTQTRIGGAAPMSGSVEADRNYGWNHTTKWYTFQVSTAGGYTVSMDRNTTSTALQPAMSIWSSGANQWDAAGSSHKFNQVQGPSATNSNAYMQTGGNDVTGFVGYANSGATFTNGDGDVVLGALSQGTSIKDPSDNVSPFNSVVTKGSFINAHAGSISAMYAGVGSSVNTSDPTLSNANGGGHVDMNLWLTPGWYVLTGGGSCQDFTCSPTSVSTSSFNIKILSNTGVSAPIPEPEMFWMFGAGLIGINLVGRLKNNRKYRVYA